MDGNSSMKGHEPGKKSSRRQEAYLTTSEFAKEAKSQAQVAFYKLIEAKVTRNVLREEVQYINPGIYEDIVTDRSSVGLCGYPLCENTFTDKYGNRTYTIINNTVYDITDRRNFCSNVCYEASELVHRQISNTPLYLRKSDTNRKKNWFVIPARAKLSGLHGKIVNITGVEGVGTGGRKQKESTVLVNEIVKESLVQCSENLENEVGHQQQKEKAAENDSSVDTQENTPANSGEMSDHEAVSRKTEDAAGQSVANEPRTGQGTPQEDTSHFIPVYQVESAMKEWMSFESLRVILGDKYVQGMLEHFGYSWQDYNTTAGLTLGVDAKAKYIALCRKLDQQEVMEERQVEELAYGETRATPKNSLPDYEQLKKDAKKQELKVVSFFGGRDQYEYLEEDEKTNKRGEEAPASDSSAKSTASGMERKKKVGEKKTKKAVREVDVESSTLPLIDNYSQMAWRQQIIMEKTKRCLGEIVDLTDLNGAKVRQILRALVTTLDLSPHNISFQPAQWSLITLVFIKLISIRYPVIANALEGDRIRELQDNILSSFDLDPGYMVRITPYLTEILPIMNKNYQNKFEKSQSNSSVGTGDGASDSVGTGDGASDSVGTGDGAVLSQHRQNHPVVETGGTKDFVSALESVNIQDENKKSTSAEELD